MGRSIWKGPFLDKIFLKKKAIKLTQIWSRRSSIPGYLVGKKISIYNGKTFKKIFITREKIGFKFGDFCFTRNSFQKKKQNKNK
jgi:ribosomal protein S19